MRIGFNAVGQNNFLNLHRAKQGIMKNSVDYTTASNEESERKDSVMISVKNKTDSLLENLMKQKTRITEQKNSLISSTLEKDGSIDSIESQLKSYQVQLKNIDKQIGDILTKEAEKQSWKMKHLNDNDPKSEEEIQNERLASVTSLSADLNQAKTISEVKTRVDGEARVLKSEVKLDKGSSVEVITNKEAKITGLQEKSNNLVSDIADKVVDIAEEIEDSNKQSTMVSNDITVTKPENTTIDKILSKDPYAVIVCNDGTVIDKRADERKASGYTYFDLVKGAMGGDLSGIGKPGSNLQEAIRLVDAVYDVPYDSVHTDEVGNQTFWKNGKPITLLNLTKEQYQEKLQNEHGSVLEYLKSYRSQFPNLYQLHFGS